MAVASSIFLSLGLILSVVIAPQLRIWTWGPTMLCLSLATLFALPAIWNERKIGGNLTITAIGSMLIFWLVGRAAFSPVDELAQSDIQLTCMAVAAFLSLRAINFSPAAQRVLTFSIAALATASIYVISKQIPDPEYSPVFPFRKASLPSGFYGHYSYGASFLLATSFILAGLAFRFARHPIVRIILGILAALTLAAIFYTKSRGAFIGAFGGISTFFVYALIIAKREEKKWFAPAIVALPIIAIASGIVFFTVGSSVLEDRGRELNLTGVFDDSIRLYLLGIAVSCFQLHPLLGGGARSFSWECFRFWDVESMGSGAHKPEHVHNELVQTATDYGIIGASLLLLLLLAAVVISMARCSSKELKSERGFEDAMRIGGAAGLMGLFIQSNFEGIFRIPPGVILLSLCLSGLCLNMPRIANRNGFSLFGALVIMLVCTSTVVTLAYNGMKAARVSYVLWPSFFGSMEAGTETKIDATSRAICIWPLFSLIQHRALLYQSLAISEELGMESDRVLELSLKDFHRASALHPFDPTSVIGTAVIYSRLDRDAEAAKAFNDAIRLQGGMEGGFKARYLYAQHLWSKGTGEFQNNDLEASIDSFAIASRTLGDSFAIHGLGWIPKHYELLIKIHTSYGRALEEIGDNKEAMLQYDKASGLPENAAHYYAGVLYGKLAVRAWSDRRGSDALFLFMNARHRIGVSTTLPDDITPEKRVEWIKYLDTSIAYLKAAKYEPSEKVDLDQGFN